MGDVTKLPKWAQQEIAALRTDVEHWKRCATAGPKESNTFISHATELTPLGASPLISFRFDDGSILDVKVAYWHERELLRVSSRHYAVSILPSASNSFFVEVGDK